MSIRFGGCSFRESAMFPMSLPHCFFLRHSHCLQNQGIAFYAIVTEMQARFLIMYMDARHMLQLQLIPCLYAGAAFHLLERPVLVAVAGTAHQRTAAWPAHRRTPLAVHCCLCPCPAGPLSPQQLVVKLPRRWLLLEGRWLAAGRPYLQAAAAGRAARM